MPKLPEEPLKAFAAFKNKKTESICLPFDQDEKQVWFWQDDIPTVMTKREFEEKHTLLED